MKKVILAVLVIAIGLFFALPNLSWAQEDVYKAKCAACHGADGKGSPAGLKMGAPGVLVPNRAKDAPTPNWSTLSRTVARRRKPCTLSPIRALALTTLPSWLLT
jgi:hypothetical protein